MEIKKNEQILNLIGLLAVMFGIFLFFRDGFSPSRFTEEMLCGSLLIIFGFWIITANIIQLKK